MSFVSKIHTSIRNARGTRRGASMRPEAAPRGGCKEYPRFPSVMLPAPEKLAMSLSEAFAQRHSLSSCAAERALTTDEWGTLLGNALAARAGTVSRNYPSGGALFPIETYVIGKVLENSRPGVFHYHPKKHAFEHLWEVPGSFKMGNLLKNPNIPLSPILVVFTAVWERTRAKYGDFAYYLGMLEAGHMAQNILLAATAMHFAARPVGGFDDEAVCTILDLEDGVEQPVYSIALCPRGAADALAAETD